MRTDDDAHHLCLANQHCHLSPEKKGSLTAHSSVFTTRVVQPRRKSAGVWNVAVVTVWRHLRDLWRSCYSEHGVARHLTCGLRVILYLAGCHDSAAMRRPGPVFSYKGYDISRASDWSRWPSRPIRSLRYIVTCTIIHDQRSRLSSLSRCASSWLWHSDKWMAMGQWGSGPCRLICRVRWTWRIHS